MTCAATIAAVSCLAIVDNRDFVRVRLLFRPAAIVVFEKVDGVARPTGHIDWDPMAQRR